LTRTARIVAYGSVGLLVIASAVCAGPVEGEPGQILALALIGSGLVILVGLVFMEVGVSENRERERERRRAERLKQRAEARARSEPVALARAHFSVRADRDDPARWRCPHPGSRVRRSLASCAHAGCACAK
jgi:hypothetical protein